jgi:hypothetical protein
LLPTAKRGYILKRQDALLRTNGCSNPLREKTMAILDRLKQELDRAGKVAQDAFDDGKTRLEAFRTRQLADKAAQSLGYAVYRARKGGSDLDAATYDRLRATLETHDTEAARLESEIELRRQQSAASRSTGTSASSETASSSADYPSSPS